jgi:hypothetical protein
MQLKGTYIKDNEETEIIIPYSFYDIIKFLIYIICGLYLFYLFEELNLLYLKI